MKIRRIDFSPDEWIIEKLQSGHLIVEIGDGFGDYRPTSGEWRQLRADVLRRDEHRCAYCSGPADTVDHVFPRMQGGLTVEANLVAACRSCNSSKGGRL
jgi:hypothetical protein